jgi:hypothetical protein
MEHFRFRCKEVWYVCCLKKRRVQTSKNFLRFQVLTSTSMNVAVFWDVAPRSLVETERRFRGTYCFHHYVYYGEDSLRYVCRFEALKIKKGKRLCSFTIALMMEAISTSETSFNIYQTTWRNIPETLRTASLCGIFNNILYIRIMPKVIHLVTVTPFNLTYTNLLSIDL